MTAAPNPCATITITSVLLTVMIFGIGVLITAQSYLDRRENELIRALLNEPAPKEKR
jgi:hypothetical protein